MNPNRFGIIVSVVIALMTFSSSYGAEAVITLEAYSPRMVEEDTTGLIDRISSGLANVGVGSKLYLLANEGDESITAYNWTLDPPAGSSATLSDPTIKNPTFTADEEGSYVVTLTVTDSTGTSDPVSLTINAANYVCVGTVGGASPSYPQCALCHEDVAENWDATGHAHFLEERLTEGPSYYGASCIECHTVGYDENPLSLNDGFDDRAEEYGWTFPDPFSPGPENWENLVDNYPEVAAAANIQCENCHGPGSAHGGTVSDNKIDYTLDAGVCAVCHDEPPYHVYPMQWETSLHANATSYPTGPGHESCVKCHSGIGFVEYLDTGANENTDYMPITCATCHDPHSADNEHQIRTLQNIELGNGEILYGGGKGKLCMNCHKSRRDAETYAVEYHDHFGPHHGPQADMLVGTNAITYGTTIPSSPHYEVVANTCVGCHMAEPVEGFENQLGEHTWNMELEGVDNVTPCLICHLGISSFSDIMADDDWDGDGTTEPAMEEVDGLIEALGMLLPPVGEPDVEVTEDYSVDELQAAYNYFSAVEDGSHGAHNMDFTVGILQASISNMTGIIQEIPEPVAPKQFVLHQNFPNPFNPVTTIQFEVPRTTRLKINVYNLNGQLVAEVVDKIMTPGIYQTEFNGKNLSSGIYVVKLKTDNLSLNRKMVLVK